MYPYTCVSCGTYFELNKRVTITKRRCSHCGYPIYPGEIDKQAEERFKKEMIGFGIGAVLGILIFLILLSIH